MDKYDEIVFGVQKLEAHLDLSPEECDQIEDQMCDQISKAQVEGVLEHDKAIELAERVLNAVQVCRDRNHHNLSND